MADADGPDGKPTVAQEALAELAKTGFFEQFGVLEQNLRTIATDLKDLGAAATQRIQETESLAVHILAVEAVLVGLLGRYPDVAEDIRATVRQTTGEGGDANPAVAAVVEDLLAKASS